MDNTNTTTGQSQNKVNKALLIVCAITVIITLALATIYLYSRYRNTKNTTVQNSVSTTPPTEPTSFILELEPAKVGIQYLTTMQLIVYNSHIQIDSEKISGLPSRLQVRPCITYYDSKAVEKFAAINSFVKCTIEGIPQQSGSFTVRVYFSIQDGAGEYFKDIPLVVNP